MTAVDKINPPTPGKDWEKSFKKMHDSDDDKLLLPDVFEDENFVK